MIAGSRKPSEALCQCVDQWFLDNKDAIEFDNWEFVHGGADGIDKYAHSIIGCLDYPAKVVRPDYQRYGKIAPHYRNDEMLDVADLVVVFWDGISPGTKSVFDKAIRRRIPVVAYVRS